MIIAIIVSLVILGVSGLFVGYYGLPWILDKLDDDYECENKKND